MCLFTCQKKLAWLHDPYMCIFYIVFTVHNCCFDNNNPLQMPCVQMFAQRKHVAIFYLPCTSGDAVIQLYDCIYLRWAKCQWSLNEVQDSAPDQQMLYNLKCPRASTAVFSEQEWTELAAYLWPCMSVVVMCIVCICATVYIVWYVSVYRVSKAEWPLPLVIFCRSVKT